MFISSSSNSNNRINNNLNNNKNSKRIMQIKDINKKMKINKKMLKFINIIQLNIFLKAIKII